MTVCCKYIAAAAVLFFKKDIINYDGDFCNKNNIKKPPQLSEEDFIWPYSLAHCNISKTQIVAKIPVIPQIGQKKYRKEKIK